MAIIYDVGRLGLTRQSLVFAPCIVRISTLLFAIELFSACSTTFIKCSVPLFPVDEDESIMRLLGLCRKASSFMYTTYDGERLFDAMIDLLQVPTATPCHSQPYYQCLSFYLQFLIYV